MGTATELLIILLLVFAMAYTGLILLLTLGWYRLKSFQSKESSWPSHFVSVVVAARNEEKKIKALLQALKAQTFPADQFEVLIINDHSEDHTVEIVEAFIQREDFPMKLIHASTHGKKGALAEGIHQARGEWIITTDADCSMGIHWLGRLVQFVDQEKPLLVMGPVSYSDKKSLLSGLFSLDFMSLVASGAGAAGLGMPFMGNGANLAFSKNAFLQVEALKDGAGQASGDDVFLIHKMLRAFGKHGISFIKDPLCMVRTDPPPGLMAFINQRLRWASKAKAYSLGWAQLVSWVVFGFNFMLVCLLIISCWQPWLFPLYLLLVLMKTLVDGPILYGFSGFSGQRKLMKYSLLLELVYPLYIVAAALLALLMPLKWKGRG